MSNQGGDLALDRRQIFQNWSEEKIRLDSADYPSFYFKERQIWWASLGKNIGHEIDGKNKQFTRPVLILAKYSPLMCLVLPLTTRIKEDRPYQFQITINNRVTAVLIEQARTLSSKRLVDKVTTLEKNIFHQIKAKFIDRL